MDRQPIDRSGSASVVAVIFGASEFPHSDSLSPSPAFERSARGFADYLKSEDGFGLADDQVLDLFDDDANVIEQNDRLIEHLTRNQAASDLIIYYVGHGGFLPDREYFLTLRSTRRGAEGVTGLRVRALAHALDEYFPGKRVFLILDCCFAGEAVAQFQASGLDEIIKNDTYDILPSAGTSLLCAASRNEPAISPTGAIYTMFSDCLLEVLRKGFGDSRRALSLADVGEVVETLVKRKFGQSAVRPEIHSPHQEAGDIARIPLFPNPGYTPPEPKTLPPELLQALRNPLADIREGAVRPLARFLDSGDAALAPLARAELERLAAGDDSLSVQGAAREALGEGPEAPAAPEPAAPEPAAKPPPDARPEPIPRRVDVAPERRGRIPVVMMLAAVLVLAVGVGVWWSITGEEAGAPPDDEAARLLREAQDDVARLLSEANEHLRAGRLGSPDGGNAVESYRAVLAIEPGNEEARKALGHLLAKFRALFDEALADGDLAGARGSLASAQKIAPGDLWLANAQARLKKTATEARNAREIQQLLAAAEADTRAGRLTGPPGNNAVERYRAILQRDGGNREARDALRRILERYVTQAEGALEAGDLAGAKEHLAEAERVAPGDETVAKLRARVAQSTDAAKHSDEIEKLLGLAEQDIEADRLTSPENNNAVERLHKVLAIDPGNRAARDGLEKVVGRYIQLADNAIADRSTRRASTYLAKAEAVAPDGAGIADARARLESVRAESTRLSAAGDEALRQDRLVEGDAPAGESAVEYYHAADALDRNNRDVGTGFRRVRDRLLELFDEAFARNDLGSARAYLDKATPFGDTIDGRLKKSHEKFKAAKLTFAIFPFESLSVCHYSVRDEVTEAVDAQMEKHQHAQLAYSYYTTSDSDAIPSTKRLWSSNITKREPMVDMVREAGRKLGVNGVFMAWYKCSHSQYVPADSYEVDVYLVDVGEDQVFHSRRKFLDVDRAVSDVFDGFFSNRGLDPG